MELSSSVCACVLRAHGGAGYTFGALAILVVLPPGKKTSRAQLCARSVPVTAIRLPPGSTASAQGDVGVIWGGAPVKKNATPVQQKRVLSFAGIAGHEDLPL